MKHITYISKSCFLKTKNPKANRSFTLLEVAVAIALIAVGIYATMALAGSSFRVMDRQKNKSIAIALAKEGMEIIRNIRDENWLIGKTLEDGSINDWRDGLNEGIRDIDYKNHKISGAGATEDCENDGQVLKLDSNDSYQHENGDDTIFKRLMAISRNEDLDGNDNANNDLLVKVIVCWTERGGEQKEVILEDHLYNWK